MTITAEFQRILKMFASLLASNAPHPKYACNSFISALAHHGVMTAYIDYAVGHATSEVSALLAGYISNVTPAMMQAFNEENLYRASDTVFLSF